MSKKDLKVTLIGDDKTGKAFNSASNGAGKMVKALAVAGAAAGAAIGVFVAKGVKDAMQLETSLREVNSLFGLSGKAGAESFKELQEGVKGVSKQVGIAQDTLTKGLYTAISAGVPRENAFTFLADAAKLGIAGVADTETAVNALTGVMNAFQKDNLSSAQAADMLFTTVRQGKTTLAELAPAIGTVGPAAAAAGVSFNDTAAALASVTKIIPNTATAAASLRQIFAESDKTGTKFNDSLKTLGAKTMGEAIKKFGSFQGVLQAVYEQSGNNDVAFKNLFGSVEAGGAALTMVGTNASVAAADLEAMAGSAGNSDLAFKEMNQSVARNMEKLKVTFQNLGIEVGNKVLPLIIAAIDKLSAWWDKHGPEVQRQVDEVAKKIRELGEKAIPIMVGAVKQAIDIVKDLTRFYNENKTTVEAVAVAIGTAVLAVKAVTAVTKTWAAVQTVMNAVLAANPIGIVIVTVAALVAGLVYAYKKSETFRDIVNGAFTTIKEGAGDAVGGMVQGFRWLLTVFMTVADGIVSGAAKALGWIPGLGPKLKEANKAFDAMKIGIEASLDATANKAYGFGEKSGVNTAKGLNASRPQAANAAAGMASAVGSSVRAVEGVGYSAGYATGMGLVNGINASRHPAVVAAQRTAEAVATTMRKGLQVASPSKLTTYFGEMVGEGLVQGMDHKQRDVARMATDLADLTGMKVGGSSYVNGRLNATAASAPVESGRSVIVNITGQVERLDEERLMTLLQRAERLAG